MKPRRIFYVTNTRLPTEKAHGIATIKLCEAFAKQGVEVVLIHPWRVNPLREDPYRYYGVERNFSMLTLPSIDFLWLGFGERVFFPIQLFSFSIIATLYLWIRYGIRGDLRGSVIFSHDHIPLFFASFISSKIFYDIHDYPVQNIFFRRVLERAIGCSVQIKWKQEALRKDFTVPAMRIVYWPNGTDIERFDIALSRDEARQHLKLSLDRKIVVYTGSLQSWKGVDTLINAAEFLPNDTCIYIVGGDERAREKLRIMNHESLRFGSGQAGIKNVVLVGQRPWQEIPQWLKAADVLVLPNTGREEISLHYTSPMKLFEYMASGRPIVASDIPSIREIVNETMVWFVAPDDPSSFATAVRVALAALDEANKRAERARAEVEKYTWSARAEKILETIKKRSAG